MLQFAIMLVGLGTVSYTGTVLSTESILFGSFIYVRLSMVPGLKIWIANQIGTMIKGAKKQFFEKTIQDLNQINSKVNFQAENTGIQDTKLDWKSPFYVFSVLFTESSPKF